MGIGIFQMFWKTRSCLGWLRCLNNPQQYAVVDHLSLENILPVSLCIEEREQTLRAQESSMVNPVVNWWS